MAPANVSFVENAGDEDVVQYMAKCRALIFPGEEDFGIVPLEAQACGKPVIAFGKGGALETIVGLDCGDSNESDATGIFFYEQDPGALVDAVQLFEAKSDAVDAGKCRDNAARFDRPRYKEEMQSYVEGVMV
jgi:glycosyltransferase involved in cell wall biosynthesis